MEYPSKNDFFLIFKPIYNNQGLFVDYMLVSHSKNFYEATNLNFDNMIGERASNIISDNEVLGLKYLYDNMVPSTIRKQEVEVEELKRLYMVNIFSDENDYLILFYNDITNIEEYRAYNTNDLSKSGNNVYGNKSESRIYYKDSLTDLYTRAFFNEELSRLDTPRQLPLTVITGDVNSLKLINDAFGHIMGDNVLKRAAEIMKRNFRKEDIISRIGGDEFAVLLPKTSEKTALEIVKRIKEECILSPVDYLIISISFGVATKVDESQDIQKIIQKADNRMYYMKIKEKKDAKLSLINNLKLKLEEITFETTAHYKRLEMLSMMMAEKLGLGEKEKEELRLLCEFHDIGKIGIPKQILQKEDSLDKDEWEDIKRHSEIGYHIFKEINNNNSVNDLILVHHERWDGNGYPGFLKSDDIPIVVRIFSLADSYEAMVNDRPYKNRISKKEALREIKNKAGTQFDPKLAEVFIELMEEKSA